MSRQTSQAQGSFFRRDKGGLVGVTRGEGAGEVRRPHTRGHDDGSWMDGHGQRRMNRFRPLGGLRCTFSESSMCSKSAPCARRRSLRAVSAFWRGYYCNLADDVAPKRYNIRKELETKLKSIPHERDKISSIPPADYALRFMTFISDITRAD